MKNTQIRLINRPLGALKVTDFLVDRSDIPPLAPNEVLVKNLYLSIDPAMRSWVSGGKSYIDSVPIGEVMRAMGTGVVIESRHADFVPGQHVYAGLGMQAFSHLTEERLNRPLFGSQLTIIDAALPLPTYLGALGISGMTAYFGLLRIGQLQPGETVVISGAAGGVGTIAGQIARLKGCRVVGITSSDEKCKALVDAFGFDAGLNYKAGKLTNQLATACPEGIDVFFDNVGGDVLNAALGHLRPGGRVVLSGAVSQYNNMRFMQGPANYLALIVNRARMEGFVFTDFANEFEHARAEIQGWIKAGLLNADTHVIPGSVDSFVALVDQLFSGQNMGKMVLEVHDN
ncbi:NADP-dependent oxidoreductase [Spirosoma pollinicola]|uniref:NADP-dependent oxidoreductase n=1 Tax=Spirosoma pollinicola TaxID=2057025 RepID=A0A2K8Z3M4_9BACT|nr:NADP-dependent oxidoreductase [Spirosoma pollinicola]AUD04439.1 NADP-dependent oxidoreductase [Spirosoma pollinicola]